MEIDETKRAAGTLERLVCVKVFVLVACDDLIDHWFVKTFLSHNLLRILC